MKKVAVTGGPASGKTTVCSLLRNLGAFVVSSDEIVHRLLSQRNTSLEKKVVDLLGPDILVDGQLDRQKIAQIVFHDLFLLKKLEAILHPLVQKEIESIYERVEKEGVASLFVVEIPLLFESGSEKFFDASVAIVCEAAIRKKRFGEKREFERRDGRLISDEQRRDRANYIIINQEGISQLEEQVGQLYHQLRSE